MPLSQFKNVVGSLATAAVLSYSYMGSQYITPYNFDVMGGEHKAPSEMNFDRYRLIENQQAVFSRQINVIHQFASNILNNMKELEPEFSRTVDRNIWDLI